MLFFQEGRRQRATAASQAARLEQSAATQYRDKLEALQAVCRTNLGTFDADLITRAFEFAARAHEKHRRKSGEPYFTHPYAVSMIVAQEIPLDDVSVAAALLHDVIEDCEDLSYEDILNEFGSTIADIVDGATKISTILKSKEVTKAENYRKLMVSMINDIRVILVKFADRLHNMRTLEYVGREKQQRIARETLEIYAPLAHRFGLGRLKWELEDLSFKYLHDQEYRQLKEQITLKRRDREELISKFTTSIARELTKLGIKHEISGRPKHLYSIFQKMVERSKTIDEIYDLFAVRIILETEEEKDCYLAYAVVCELFTPIPERYKNYIALPKQNGYKSIHTTVLSDEGRMVEVQIRTRKMHDIAEKGIAAHWAYKESVQIKQSAFDNWIRWVREVLEAQTTPGDDESARQLVDDFKRNLYQEEIVVFTPKGDLRVLPNNSTPVDFAFEIHSEVGLHTIGAKVNGRIVPLNRKLRSGDQVEIITSRNQHLSQDWEQFVITHKAKMAIRRFINDRMKQEQMAGREKWERKLKKLKQRPTDDDMLRVSTMLGYSSPSKLYIAIGTDDVHVDEVAEVLNAPPPAPPLLQIESREPSEVFEQFAHQAREEKGILIEGRQESIQYDFARCCNPLPGDAVLGFVTQGHGIKIHRRSCRNIQRLLESSDSDGDGSDMRNRLVDIDWPAEGDSSYLSGIRVEGEDRPGILNEIALAITSYANTNIRSVNFESEHATFAGAVLVSVKNLEHLQRLIERVRKVRGIIVAERFVEAT